MKFKNSNGQWQTIKFKNYGIEQTPIGSMIYYPSQTIPSGYLVCDGSTYLIADYPLLFNAIGYSRNVWLLSIETNGAVEFARYGTTNYADVSTSVWLPFQATFLID